MCLNDVQLRLGLCAMGNTLDFCGHVLPGKQGDAAAKFVAAIRAARIKN
jgi:hypothetical protein